MKKKEPTEYTECYSAEWLRYEARETQKFFCYNLPMFFSVFFCVFCGPFFKDREFL